MRFKPPPSLDSKIGWRVEFRTMDIQLTDFENAALTVLLLMIVNLANHFDVDFIQPITQVDENMRRAHKVDSVLKERFLVKTSILPRPASYRKNTLAETDFARSGEGPPQVEEKYEELCIWEILEGKPGFKGIYPLIEEFMEDARYSKEQVAEVRKYLSFLLDRAKGRVPTGARFIRDFVAKHPAYRKDSVVNSEVAYDLMGRIMCLANEGPCRDEFLNGKAI